MPLLSNDGFLTKLAQLFSDTTVKGSVWITIKQVNRPTPIPDDPPKVCYRATNGKTGRSISTHVTSENLTNFSSLYQSLLKACTPALKKTKKTDKSRRKGKGGGGGSGSGGAAAGGAGAAAPSSSPTKGAAAGKS